MIPPSAMNQTFETRGMPATPGRGTACVVLISPAPELAALYGRRFQVILLEFVGETVRLWDDRRKSALKYLPQSAAAVIVAREQTEVEAAALKSWLCQANLDLTVVVHAPGLDLLLESMSAGVQQHAQINSVILRRLAEMRAIHEELQNSYDALRSYISEGGFVHPKLGFTNPPDPENVTLPDGVTEVLQPIPLELRSLCGISLHLKARVPRFAEGRLVVELLAADDDDIRFTWHMAYGSIQPGWITFAFDQNAGFLRRSPLLKLRTLNELFCLARAVYPLPGSGNSKSQFN